MNYYTGIDIGSTASKVVVLDEGQMVDHFVLPTGWSSRETAAGIARRLEQALNSTENLVQQLRGLQGDLEGLREYYPRMTEGENPELFFDGEGNPCGSEAGEYGITLTRTQEEGLVYVLLESRDMQGEELYTLRAPICIREEGQDG